MSVLWYPMQLSMVIPSESEARIPPAPVPEGYELRGYQPGDDESWLALINTGAFGTPWPRSKFDEYLCGARAARRLAAGGQGRQGSGSDFRVCGGRFG